MKTSNRGIELIKRHEGFRPRAYLCPAGKWTVGYGHTRTAKPGMMVTELQAVMLLQADLKEAEYAVNRQKLRVNQNQFDALVSFTFNLGIGNFNRSSLLKQVKANPENLLIRGEFGKWIYAANRVLAGLINRRNEEANLYFSKL